MSKTHQYRDLKLRLISLLRHLVVVAIGTIRSIATSQHNINDISSKEFIIFPESNEIGRK